MSLQNWIFSPTSFGLLQLTKRSKTINYDIYLRRIKPKTYASLTVGTDAFVDILHNKVLITAAVCSVVGQLMKPFTASILYQSGFDFKAAFQAGGFPSTHSSAAVATAMALGLERGFSDSIFGLAVVYASLTMYDAQGVRREVGSHAKIINGKLLEEASFDASDSLIKSSSKSTSDSGLLKESIGHTEIEVIAGAFLGLLVSIAIYSF